MAFAFAVFVLGLDYALPNRGRSLGLAIWLLIVIITAQHDLLPLWRTYMVIDKFGISGRANRDYYEIYWIEIVAAAFFRDAVNQPHLTIATHRDTFSIPLLYLDSKRIWQQICNHVKPELLGEVAYEQRLERQKTFQDLVKEETLLIHGTGSSVRLQAKGWVIALGWSAFTFFLGVTIISTITAGLDLCYSPVFIAFTALSCLAAYPQRS